MAESKVREMDPEQSMVVAHRGGSALVVAGAGSGKTTTIVTRAVSLLREGVKPENMLMLTFSRKAADEMRGRMVLMLMGSGIDVNEAFVGTYHSFGYTLIRSFWSKMGFKNVPTPMDDKESEALLKPSMLEKIDKARAEKSIKDELVWEKIKPGFILEIYSGFRDDGYHLGDKNAMDIIYEYWQAKGGVPLPENLLMDVFATLISYEKAKAERCVIDYDDMICRVVDMLDANKELCDELSGKYQWVTVDESQDTSYAQYRMIHLIGKKHGNVVMVGDDDQAIYSWRGARKENLDRFHKDFSADLYRLQYNYRSKADIVVASSAHIAHNTNRFGNKAKPVRPAGNQMKFLRHPDGYTAGKRIASFCKHQISTGIPAGEIAVLYRTNQMAKAISLEFAKQGIPFRVVGDMDIRKKKEVKLMVAAVRLFLDNPFDLPAFNTIAEVVDGLGAGAVAKVEKDMLERKVRVIDADQLLKGKAKDAMARLRQASENLIAGGMDTLVSWLTGSSGLNATEYWTRREPDDVVKRLDSLDMVQALISRDLANSEDPVGDFFRIFLDSSFQDDTDDGAVTLSTIHRAKGLEWKVVHLFGFSDSLLPFGTKMAHLDRNEIGNTDIHEERNLSYVAMTRAKDVLYIHHADEYVMFGTSTGKLKPSVFLDEIPHFSGGTH